MHNVLLRDRLLLLLWDIGSLFHDSEKVIKRMRMCDVTRMTLNKKQLNFQEVERSDFDLRDQNQGT